MYLPQVQERNITLADSWKEGQNESDEKECWENREQDFNPITSPIEGRQEKESEIKFSDSGRKWWGLSPLRLTP